MLRSVSLTSRYASFIDMLDGLPFASLISVETEIMNGYHSEYSTVLANYLLLFPCSRMIKWTESWPAMCHMCRTYTHRHNAHRAGELVCAVLWQFVGTRVRAIYVE